MSDKLYEIAFSGQIVDGADLESVKQKIGKIFKADEERLAKMFSGQRVLIKRQADEITMVKYRGAFQKSGAICEVVDLSKVSSEPPAKPQAESTTPQLPNKESAAPLNDAAGYVSKYPESDEVPQALLTEPLGISAENIEDLATDIAPAGSQLISQLEQVPEPVIDISGMDVAPVGSVLSTEKAEEPPPPDTAGLTMAD